MRLTCYIEPPVNKQGLHKEAYQEYPMVSTAQRKSSQNVGRWTRPLGPPWTGRGFFTSLKLCPLNHKSNHNVGNI